MTKARRIELLDQLAEENPEALLPDGLERAFLGYAQVPVTQKCVAVYSAKKCIEIIIKRDHMNYREAVEFFHFNVLDAYVGDDGPLFVLDHY